VQTDAADNLITMIKAFLHMIIAAGPSEEHYDILRSLGECSDLPKEAALVIQSDIKKIAKDCEYKESILSAFCDGLKREGGNDGYASDCLSWMLEMANERDGFRYPKMIGREVLSSTAAAGIPGMVSFVATYIDSPLIPYRTKAITLRLSPVFECLPEEHKSRVVNLMDSYREVPAGDCLWSVSCAAPDIPFSVRLTRPLNPQKGFASGYVRPRGLNSIIRAVRAHTGRHYHSADLAIASAANLASQYGPQLARYDSQVSVTQHIAMNGRVVAVRVFSIADAATYIDNQSMKRIEVRW